MKVAVVGTGKTGGRVAELLGNNRIHNTYDEHNPPTAQSLKEADVAIIFVPGAAVEQVWDAVYDSAVPAVWGSTGFEWPGDLNEKLKSAGYKWLKASNFSLGMNIIRRCLRLIGEGSEVLDEPEFSIHEVHHVHKKDAPSGTALSWQQWLGRDAVISSERKGDIKGIHELRLKTAMESIWLKHEAHDRAVFARGAIWAAEQLLKPEVDPGFHDFSALFDQYIGME